MAEGKVSPLAVMVLMIRFCRGPILYKWGMYKVGRESVYVVGKGVKICAKKKRR